MLYVISRVNPRNCLRRINFHRQNSLSSTNQFAQIQFLEISKPQIINQQLSVSTLNKWGDRLGSVTAQSFPGKCNNQYEIRLRASFRYCVSKEKLSFSRSFLHNTLIVVVVISLYANLSNHREPVYRPAAFSLSYCRVICHTFNMIVALANWRKFFFISFRVKQQSKHSILLFLIALINTRLHSVLDSFRAQWHVAFIIGLIIHRSAQKSRESVSEREVAVSAPARSQSGELVSLGRGSARTR